MEFDDETEWDEETEDEETEYEEMGDEETKMIFPDEEAKDEEN